MQQKPLKKRLLFYLLLLPIISIIVPLVIALLILASPNSASGHERAMILVLYLSPLIIHYLFGLIFLNTKSIIKFFVPIVTTFSTVGLCILLLWWYTIFFNMDDLYRDIILLFFLISIIVWEMTYQILKKIYKSDDVKNSLFS